MPVCRKVEDIINSVCADHSISRDLVLGRSRRVPLVRARHRIWYEVNRQLTWSSEEIAEYFNVDSGTVRRAWGKYRKFNQCREYSNTFYPTMITSTFRWG
jgi:chromosomal replication initiation ATPase DnaA